MKRAENLRQENETYAENKQRHTHKKIHKKYSRDEMKILETDKQENLHFQTNCCTIPFSRT